MPGSHKVRDQHLCSRADWSLICRHSACIAYLFWDRFGPFWGQKCLPSTYKTRVKFAQKHTRNGHTCLKGVGKPGRGVRERKERGFCRRPKLSQVQQPKQWRPNPQLSQVQQPYVSPICVASHNVVVDGGRLERLFTLGSMQSAGGDLRRHEVRGSLWGCGYCALY